MDQFSDSVSPPVPPSYTSAASPPMRRLIRSRSTGTFLTQEGAWTRNLAEAATFGDQAAAVAAMRQFNLQNAVEMYYSFDDSHPSQWDFAIALG